MHKGDTWWLHLPFTERVPIRGKAEARRISEPDLKVGMVDLNADSTVAAPDVPVSHRRREKARGELTQDPPETAGTRAA